MTAPADILAAELLDAENPTILTRGPSIETRLPNEQP